MSTRSVIDCDDCGREVDEPATVMFGAVRLDLCGPCAADGIHRLLPLLSPEQRERWAAEIAYRGVAQPMPGQERDVGGSD